MNKKILSIEHDDDNKNYEVFNDFLLNHTKTKKKVLLKEIEMFGDDYLNEIEWKKKKENEKKNKLIPYIIKNSINNYNAQTLSKYSYQDVLDIYNEEKKQNQTLFTKIINFIFNLS